MIDTIRFDLIALREEFEQFKRETNSDIDYMKDQLRWKQEAIERLKNDLHDFRHTVDERTWGRIR